MAYLKNIERMCEEDACTSLATHEVMNNRNESRGAFCWKHGQRRFREQEKAERAETARQADA